MTPLDLLKLSREATEAPWKHDPDKQWNYPGGGALEFVAHSEGGCVAATGPIDDRQSMKDAALIAAARNAVEDLAVWLEVSATAVTFQRVAGAFDVRLGIDSDYIRIPAVDGRPDFGSPEWSRVKARVVEGVSSPGKPLAGRMLTLCRASEVEGRQVNSTSTLALDADGRMWAEYNPPGMHFVETYRIWDSPQDASKPGHYAAQPIAERRTWLSSMVKELCDLGANVDGSP